MLIGDVLCHLYFLLLEDIISKCNSLKELHFLALLAQTRKHLGWQIWPQKQKTSSISRAAPNSEFMVLQPFDVNMSQIQR